jgi:hypothetical protein
MRAEVACPQATACHQQAAAACPQAAARNKQAAAASLLEDLGVAEACNVQVTQSSQERDYDNIFFHTCEAACAWLDKLP